MNLPHMKCRQCGSPLMLRRTWQHVFLHCRDCSADYPVGHMTEAMDQELEDALANIPCDRI